MSIIVKSDITKHERTIILEDAPDIYSNISRGGCWFSPTWIRVNTSSIGGHFLWVGGVKRNKNGDLGQQDAGESFSLDEPDSYSPLAPQWVLDIVKAGES